jgi:hypothetical protein
MKRCVRKFTASNMSNSARVERHLMKQIVTCIFPSVFIQILQMMLAIPLQIYDEHIFYG